MTTDLILVPPSKINQFLRNENQHDDSNILFNHTLFAHCCLPIKRLPNNQNKYEIRHGNHILVINSGTIINNIDNGEVMESREIPYGSKARIIFAHLNNWAIKNRSKEIYMFRNPSQFMENANILKSGLNYKSLLEQMKNIGASKIILIKWLKDHNEIIASKQKQFYVSSDIDMWKENEDRGGKFWNGVFTLSQDYYDSLLEHAMPLNINSYMALDHNPRAMDIYSWLSYRLCTIDDPKGIFISYKHLHPIFGVNIKHVWDFKINFNDCLNVALTQYPTAKIELLKDGIRLFYTPSPIPPKELTKYKFYVQQLNEPGF